MMAYAIGEAGDRQEVETLSPHLWPHFSTHHTAAHIHAPLTTTTTEAST